MVFSDESHFQLCPDNHRRRVWRRLGQYTNPAFTIAHHTCPEPGVMVWEAISYDSHTPLVVFRGTLTAQRYVDGILRTVLLPFLLHRERVPCSYFQQDNAKPRTARVTMNCLAACQTLS
ncbi:transposable element Tc1 transposase [Trichonephila clavipes]|nr:transposable element Tc1 transposase [Trichonephila clavipes]